eukprot:symbB.v1.2.023199.t1/scaffold2107.1/size91221/8
MATSLEPTANCLKVAESTPSPRTLDAPPKLLKANSEGSSQPASTPGEEALRSTEVVEAPSPKSGFELASPSQLPQTLAEARQREQRESEETHVSFADSAPAAVFMQPPSPVFLQPAEEPVPEQNEAETPLLRLEPAPCTQGSEVRTVAQSRNEDPAEVAGTPSNEAMELRETLPQAISSPPRRTPVPALAMSWAEMEVAALDPTPKCRLVANETAIHHEVCRLITRRSVLLNSPLLWLTLRCRQPKEEATFG